MKFRKLIILGAFVLAFGCCKHQKNETTQQETAAKLSETEIIVDCNYTFDAAMRGSRAPQSIVNQLELITVQYISFDNKIHRGQIMVNKKIAPDVQAMFDFMLQERFPVAKVVPVVAYDWNDERSMAANNSSGFCYRNPSYSFHAEGLAVDINPLLNPVVWRSGARPNEPANAEYRPQVQGTFTAKSAVVQEFLRRGFRWGANFSQKADYHHFEKGTPKVLPRRNTPPDSVSGAALPESEE
jgi:hypothetical protein